METILFRWWRMITLSAERQGIAEEGVAPKGT